MSQRLPAWVSANTQMLEVATDLVAKTDASREQVAELLDPEVGHTDSEVVYKENKLELHYYEPDEVAQETPIFFVYSLVNRPYIVDLQPDRSVLQQLLDGGYEVYLIDWGEPSRLDRSLTMADYVHRYIHNCVDAACDHADTDEVHLAGYCMGGNLAIAYATHAPERVRTLMLMATPLAFEGDGGILERWANHYDPDAVVDALGNVPWRLLNWEFTLMDPVEHYVTKYVQLYENLEKGAFVEQFARMEKWSWDGVDLAGETYREFVTEVYKENRMIESEYEVGGQVVDLSDIEMPVLQLVGEHDHLVPPETSRPLNDEISSEDERIIEFPVGHIGLSISSYAHAELWPQVVDWFQAREPGAEKDPDATAVDAIDGIGPTYARRLDEAGIRTTDDLAEYGPEELADIADTYSSRTEDWLEQVA